MNVLLILTSHSLLGRTGRRTGFWLDTLATPYYILANAGIQTTFASPRGGMPPVDPASECAEHRTASTRRFLDDLEVRDRLGRSSILGALDPCGWDALLYAGGHGAMWDLPGEPASRALLERFAVTGRPIAAIGHGVAALLNVRLPDGEPLLKNRRVTAFSNREESALRLMKVIPYLLEDRLVAGGARYRHAANSVPMAVVDGQLVTGQNPGSAALVAGELLALLERQTEAASQAAVQDRPGSL